MKTNSAVRHPFEALSDTSDRFLTWLADRALPSAPMFYIAFTVPLLAIPMSDSIKLVVSTIAGSWISWWAMSALQRTQIKADHKRELKATADHEALTHLANRADESAAALVELAKKIDSLGGNP